MLNSSNISFQSDLALKIGLNEAIVLQKIYDIKLHLKSFENLTWFNITHIELHNFFPFWSLEDVKQTLDKLVEDEYLFLKNGSFEINYEKLNLENKNIVKAEETKGIEKFKTSQIAHSDQASNVEKYQKAHSLKEQDDEFIEEIDRVITHFDFCRKKIQKNYVRQEFGNKGGEYLLRLHIAETGRTPQMFNGAIRWLFSDDKEAKFWRDNTMNIGALIKNYNSIEMKYISNSKESKMQDRIQRAVEFYRKKGYTDQEIEEGLKNGTL